MTAPAATFAVPAPSSRTVVAGAILLLTLALLPMEWSWVWPKEWVLPLAPPITSGFKWLARDFTIGGVEFGALLRAGSKIVEWPMRLAQGLLAKGLSLSVLQMPAIPWFALLGAASMLAHWAGGRRLALLMAGTGAYLLVLGLWESAMLTIALVLVAVLAGVVLGAAAGIAAWKSRPVERMLTPIYDLLQVLPIFSYLLPIIVFFGFGPLAGLVATVIFAAPPMARVTTLALRKLPRSVFELAAITGCRGFQRLWLVLLPSARTDLLVGVNQVVNLSFAVAVFAAIIGAGGLGNDLFAALKALRLGPAMEAGIAITLLAIALDRLFRAIALKRTVHAVQDAHPLWVHRHSALTVALLLLGFIAAIAFPDAARFPKAWTFTTGNLWNEAVAALNASAGEAIGRLRDGLIVGLLRPFKDFLQAVPWSAAIGAVAIAAVLLDGWKLALSLGLLLLAIVVTGYWPAAMTSLYLVALGAMLAAAIGFPLGLAGALSPRLAAFNDVLVDTIQTLPPFVYLVPIMMVLGIGDVPALASIALYSIAPAIRYTQSGLLQVRRSVLEAATMSGCNRRQRLFLVQLPIAVPDVLLGLNQTVVMAFGMLVITALVGTRGLEATTLIALGKVDTGTGLIAGFGLVALTIVSDRLLTATAGVLTRKAARAV